jgi:sterol desaturase/sphingolipid hydroxylase (fatty acid hydroxylase superfamily)
MIDRYLMIQVITFFIAMLACEFIERRYPGFIINKKKDMRLNLLALLVIVLIGEYVKKSVALGYDSVHLSSALAGNWFTRLPIAPKLFFAVAFVDFCLYWIHRAMHRPILWATHKFHHTIGEIWWLAGSRTSLTHLLLFAVPQVFIGYYLLRLSPMEAAIILSFSILVNIWLHLNVWFNFGPFEWLFITPNCHRIHHGARGLMNKNLGFVFSIWDRMFGTFVSPKTLGKEFNLYPVPTSARRLIRMMVGI